MAVIQDSGSRAARPRLRRLDIRGFRGLESISLELSAATCIIGPISSGKSAVADAIRMLFHSGRGAGSLRLSEWDFSRSQLADDELLFDVKALLGPIDNDADESPADLLDLIEYCDEETLEPSLEPSPASMKAVQLGFQGKWSPSEGTFSYEHYSPKLSRPGELRRVRTDTRDWLGVNVIGAGRSFWNELAPHSHSSFHRLLVAADADIPGAAQLVADALGGAGARLSRQQGFTQSLSRLETRLTETTGTDRLGLRLGAGLSSRMGALSKLSLVTETDSPLELEGSGTASAAILSALLEVGGLGVVIVDAPEASLPPTLQRSLVAKLISEADQSIVITHSPSIISLFDPEEIIVLRGSKKPLVLKTELDNMSSAGQLRRFWRSRPDFMACLTGKWALLVEGPSDLITYGRVLEHVSRSEKDMADLLGMWMLDGGGTDAVHLLKFLERCGVRTCMILDGDKEGGELRNFQMAASRVVQLPDGKDLEDLLLECTDDGTLRSRIEALRTKKAETLEHVAVASQILESGDPEPFVLLFRRILQAIHQGS